MPKQKLQRALFLLAALAGSGLFLLFPQHIQAANPATISFQGKIVNANGTNIADGTYSVVFRIYNTASPTMTTSCTSTASCLWQETQASVSVSNGIFQVELGSSCALTSSSCNNSAGGPINYSSTNSLYLTMQFNGDTSGTRGGFMFPLIHMNSVPFALNADNSSNLGGIAAAGYLQLAPNAVQTDTSTSNVSLFINKNNASGAPNILQLQKTGADVLSISNGGALSVSPVGDNLGTTIKQTSGAATSGNLFDIVAANGTSHFIQISQTAANAGAITISSLGSNTLTLQGGSSAILDAATGSTITLGNSGSGNFFQLAATTREPTLNGSARHTRTINLSPEYPGAVMTGDGSNNTGTMTSDFCSNNGSLVLDTTSCPTAGDSHTFYNWTSTTTGSSDYDIYVRYLIPSDWAAIASDSSIVMSGWRTDSTATTEVDLALFQANGTQCGSTTNVATGTATWSSVSLSGTISGCSLSANDKVIFRIHVTVAQNKTVKAGGINISYLSKW